MANYTIITKDGSFEAPIWPFLELSNEINGMLKKSNDKNPQLNFKIFSKKIIEYYINIFKLIIRDTSNLDSNNVPKLGNETELIEFIKFIDAYNITSVNILIIIKHNIDQHFTWGGDLCNYIIDKNNSGLKNEKIKEYFEKNCNFLKIMQRTILLDDYEKKLTDLDVKNTFKDESIEKFFHNISFSIKGIYKIYKSLQNIKNEDDRYVFKQIWDTCTSAVKYKYGDSLDFEYIYSYDIMEKLTDHPHDKLGEQFIYIEHNIGSRLCSVNFDKIDNVFKCHRKNLISFSRSYVKEKYVYFIDNKNDKRNKVLFNLFSYISLFKKSGNDELNKSIIINDMKY